MGQVAYQNVTRHRLSQTGPPPNSANQVKAQGTRYKGHGDPNGVVPGYQGDEYLDLDTSTEWQKLADNNGRPSVTTWVAETPQSVTDRLAEIASNGGYKAMHNIVYSPAGPILTADVVWPDDSPGVYTATLNATLGTVDSFTVTHTDSAKTVTQPTITRNASGQAIDQPEITVT
jgi:hypothetical protein